MSLLHERTHATPLEIVDQDQGVLLGRMFPFGEVARIRELDETGQVIEYDEEFLPGCTTRLRQKIAAIGRANFLGLQLGHDEPGVARHLGYGLAVHERDDGGYGEFQLYTKRPDYALVREMLGTAWNGLSISFRDRVNPRVTDEGVVGRRQIDIEHVAAVPVAAYASAGVLSIRTSDVTIDLGTPALDAAIALLAELRAESESLTSAGVRGQ